MRSLRHKVATSSHVGFSSFSLSLFLSLLRKEEDEAAGDKSDQKEKERPTSETDS